MLILQIAARGENKTLTLETKVDILKKENLILTLSLLRWSNNIVTSFNMQMNKYQIRQTKSRTLLRFLVIYGGPSYCNRIAI